MNFILEVDLLIISAGMRTSNIELFLYKVLLTSLSTQQKDIFSLLISTIANLLDISSSKNWTSQEVISFLFSKSSSLYLFISSVCYSNICIFTALNFSFSF